MAEKENLGHMIDGKAHKTGGIRRVLMEAAPIKEKKVLKEKSVNNASTTPDADTWEPPEIVDDGKKPPYSYATLIGMAILRAANRRLTLAQIYKWIADSFLYYRASNNGWQNSIRHNLSLNKAFVKQERPKDDPGKGNYWVVQKGCEQQFMKSKNARKSGKKAPSAPLSSSPPSSQQSIKLLPPMEDIVKPKKSSPEIEIHVDSELPALKPSEHEGTSDTIEDPAGSDAMEDWIISSDATRSAGSISPEPSRRDVFSPSPAHGNLASSSPPHLMCSSPPLTRAKRSQPFRETTPPSSYTTSSLRKRKLSQMNDSGYFSSLESSTLRPDEKPRIKRGRAEEEIARIRHHPQHESPTRRSTMAPASNGMLGALSPLRNYDINPMLPPLTPATTLRPQKPPRSISPQTNLRLHRDGIRRLIGSPSRDMDVLGDDPWGSTLAALACHEFAMDHSDDAGDVVTRTCFGSPERGLGSATVKFNPTELFGDSFFDTPDLFGVDVFGVMKNGFERFTNDCPDSPSIRPRLQKSHTTNF